MKTFGILVTALAMLVAAVSANECTDRCQNEFVDCFTRTGDFDGCEAIRSMSSHPLLDITLVYHVHSSSNEFMANVFLCNV